MTGALLLWWLALCAASALNIGAWAASAWQLNSRRGYFTSTAYATRRLLLQLSAAYVLGCAFRSLLPMIDVPRMCLHDTWASRIVIGRSIATIAEVCFVAQWALLLREAGVAAHHRFAMRVASSLIPLILIAEGASWFAVLSTNNFFHALENSLWTLAAALAIVACATMRSRFEGKSRRFLDSAIGAGALYVIFMVTVDVPMYLSRWIADTGANHQNLALMDGLSSMMQRCIVVRDWALWREDALWLSLYFTLAVWMSIALSHVPAFKVAQHPHPQAVASKAVRHE